MRKVPKAYRQLPRDRVLRRMDRAIFKSSVLMIRSLSRALGAQGRGIVKILAEFSYERLNSELMKDKNANAYTW